MKCDYGYIAGTQATGLDSSLAKAVSPSMYETASADFKAAHEHAVATMKPGNYDGYFNALTEHFLRRHPTVDFPVTSMWGRLPGRLRGHYARQQVPGCRMYHVPGPHWIGGPLLSHREANRRSVEHESWKWKERRSGAGNVFLFGTRDEAVNHARDMGLNRVVHVDVPQGKARRDVGEGHPFVHREIPAHWIHHTESISAIQKSFNNALDCFVGDIEDAPFAYIVQQLDQSTGKADELKVMLGFASADHAKRMYLAHYDSPKFFGGIRAVPMEQFRRLVERAHVKKACGTLPSGGALVRSSNLKLSRWLDEERKGTINFDDESELIRCRKANSSQARRRHKFDPARWTHPNMHPRCRICGDEERIGGMCEGVSLNGGDVSESSVPLAKAVWDRDAIQRNLLGRREVLVAHGHYRDARDHVDLLRHHPVMSKERPRSVLRMAVRSSRDSHTAPDDAWEDARDGHAIHNHPGRNAGAMLSNTDIRAAHKYNVQRMTVVAPHRGEIVTVHRPPGGWIEHNVHGFGSDDDTMQDIANRAHKQHDDHWSRLGARVERRPLSHLRGLLEEHEREVRKSNPNHAPAGGADADGKRFQGGQFVPSGAGQSVTRDAMAPLWRFADGARWQRVRDVEHALTLYRDQILGHELRHEATGFSWTPSREHEDIWGVMSREPKGLATFERERAEWMLTIPQVIADPDAILRDRGAPNRLVFVKSLRDAHGLEQHMVYVTFLHQDGRWRALSFTVRDTASGDEWYRKYESVWNWRDGYTKKTQAPLTKGLRDGHGFRSRNASAGLQRPLEDSDESPPTLAMATDPKVRRPTLRPETRTPFFAAPLARLCAAKTILTKAATSRKPLRLVLVKSTGIRLHQFLHSQPFAVVSAERGNLSRAENHTRTQRLYARIKELGYPRAHSTNGSWIEDRDGKPRRVMERSFIVPAMSRDHVHRLASEFSQEAYIHSGGDLSRTVLHDKGKTFPATHVKMHPSGDDIWSRRGGHSFVHGFDFDRPLPTRSQT